MLGGKKKKKRKIQLELGELEFHFSDETWNADLIELKLMFEQLEATHELTSVEGQFVATSEFLSEAAQSLSALGCPRKTQTVARQIWVAVSDTFAICDENFRRSLAKALRK